ncbi:hypothetical protein PHLGIDRAFT_33323 [Phlebiopsis gigantea 11061_1 CR5-6]|uniref:Uncharacterized protein n=1 Tax=Phlebiopsis gigantea (strain 11061_1 CR5-6) TaxID=745531 RepID=A0A0C3PV19_PHLG1|nr:hypothetical protein PHLGIDRAFT_33323 [Phlebiopsis gigantea 11061_1 CR5-6]
MPPRLSPLDIAVLVLALARGVASQITSANCLAGFDWTFNGRSQSPCLLAAYLDGACLSDPSQAFVDALAPDHHYTLPTSAADDCYCNTVFYSVMAACSACQDDEFLPYTTWTTNCTNTFLQTFPESVPVGTAIPAWAFLPIEPTDNLWNLTVAKAYAAENTTEITAPSASASGSSPSASSPATSASVGSSASGTPTAVAAASSKKSNTGAIVGGVVGGVGGALLLAAALLLWFRHRRAQRRPPSAQFRQPSPPPLVATPYSPESEKPLFSPVSAAFSAGAPAKLYNPDDPSTFPDAQRNVDSVYSQGNRGSAVFSAQNGYQPAGIHYSGVAEI